MKKTTRNNRKIFALGGLALMTAAVIGCSSDSNEFVHSGGTPPPAVFRVIEPGPISNEKGSVDTLEMKAFDAGGNLVAGPTEVLFSTTTDFPPLPTTAARVELDYLRNGGYPLFRANLDVADSGQGFLGQSSNDGVVVNGVADDPDEKPVSGPTTAWSINNDGAGTFRLVQTHTDATGKETTQPDFRIKGVCYSPSPINVVGDGAPNIGDFFIDNVTRPGDKSQVDFYNWFALWGTRKYLYTFEDQPLYSRGDLDKIRGLGANSLRVYSFLSRHQGDPAVPNSVQYPDPETSYHHTHTQFLDECYNNGKDPLYVMVGIPTPSDLWYLSLKDKTPAKMKLYLKNLQEVVQDVGDHPAVIGFCLVNEINEAQHAYPGMQADKPETAQVNENSDYYWGRMKAYSDQTKTTAPDKLVGAAFHDFREIAQYVSEVPTTGSTYLEQLTNLDFAGVNTYHRGDYPDVFTRGWLAIPPEKRKPLIWTELGFSATTRPDISDPLTGFGDTAESRQRTADALKQQLPKAHANEGVLGMYYFEYCDEWWKQGEDSYTAPNPFDPNNTIQVRRADRWYGGPPDGGFPNGTHDQEGFGLFSVKRYGNLANNATVLNAANNGPDGRVDIHTERTEITSVLKDFWKTLTPRS
ncbi:MAG: hypothetical protein WC314_10655 [Vulcanimicrobiota bacterium]